MSEHCVTLPAHQAHSMWCVRIASLWCGVMRTAHFDYILQQKRSCSVSIFEQDLNQPLCPPTQDHDLFLVRGRDMSERGTVRFAPLLRKRS